MTKLPFCPHRRNSGIGHVQFCDKLTLKSGVKVQCELVVPEACPMGRGKGKEQEEIEL